MHQQHRIASRHRNNHLGLSLAKLALDIGGAVIKKKIMDREAANSPRTRDPHGRLKEADTAQRR